MKKFFLYLALIAVFFACNDKSEPDDPTEIIDNSNLISVLKAIQNIEDKNTATRLEVSGDIGILDWLVIRNLPDELPAIEELVLHDLTVIPTRAFIMYDYEYGVTTHNTWLKKLIAPNVKTIKEYAFKDCTALEEVDLGENTTVIEPYAFANTNITSIHLPAVEFLPQGAFQSCYKLINVSMEKVTAIGADCFLGTKIKSIKMPNLKTIDDKAFSYTNLEKIHFPNVTSIGRYCFSGCLNLEEVVLESLEVLPESTFYGHGKLKKVVLPSVIYIHGRTFYSNNMLEVLELTSPLLITTEQGFMGYYVDYTQNITLYLNEINFPTPSELGKSMWRGYQWGSILKK